MSSLSHPDRFIPISDGWYVRYQAIMRLTRRKQDGLLLRERNVLEGDPLGLVQREHLWAKIHDAHRAFTEFDGPVVDITARPPQYSDASPFTDVGLPRVFFLNFDRKLGLDVRGERDRVIEGAYFVECMIGGKTGYRYVVVTDTPRDIDGEKVTLGESLLDQTRAAVGFVEIGQTLDESIDQIGGDPMICRAVQTARTREALINGIEFTADLSLDVGKAKNASSRGSTGMRLAF